MPILEVKNLKVVFDNKPVLDGISFSLNKGEALAALGPNGSGKTTLFKAIIGAIPFEGKIIRAKELKIGYVPQKIDLERDLPITVGEFFELRNGVKKTDYNPKEALELVGLPAYFLKKKIGELSAGEFQRVLISWAVLSKPDLLLFDEPTASVDVAGQETVYELLRRLQTTYDLALILISHDLSVVYHYADKVLCLNHSQICLGVPKDVLNTQKLEELYGPRKYYEHI